MVKLVALSVRDEDSVDVNCPDNRPPHCPRPQPVAAVSNAKPTG